MSIERRLVCDRCGVSFVTTDAMTVELARAHAANVGWRTSCVSPLSTTAAGDNDFCTSCCKHYSELDEVRRRKAVYRGGEP